MTGGLLLENLKQLGANEAGQLKKFVDSPFFNQNKQLATLLSYLLDCLDKANVPDNASIFTAIFGAKAPYKDEKVRLACSDLGKLVEEFLVHQQIKQDTFFKQLMLSRHYRRQGLDKHFERMYQKTETTLLATPYRNASYYAHKNQLEWERYEFMSAKKREVDTNLQHIVEDFDQSYCSERLKQACTLKSQQAFYAIQYDFTWVAQIIDYVERKNWLTVPAIALYYYAYQLYTDGDKAEHFEVLKKEIVQSSGLFPPEELRNLYVLALNFCIRKVNSGQKSYLKESMDLYKAGLKANCFLEKGILSKYTYTNIVANGLMTKDYEWVESFIHDYKNCLTKEHRASSFSFNAARLEYTKNKNYPAALAYLQKVSDQDLLNTLNAKILQLRIYYEIKAYDLLASHLEAMENFIRRKKVIGYNKDNFLNCIKFTKKLLKLNFFDQQAIQHFAEAIQSERVLTEKEWLLERLREG